jgi:hypothetical protein
MNPTEIMTALDRLTRNTANLAGIVKVEEIVRLLDVMMPGLLDTKPEASPKSFRVLLQDYQDAIEKLLGGK